MHKQGTWLLSLCVATGLVGRGAAQTPETPVADSAPVPVWPESGPAMPPAPEPAAEPAPTPPEQSAPLGRPSPLGQIEPTASVPDMTGINTTLPEAKPAPALDVPAPTDPVPDASAPAPAPTPVAAAPETPPAPPSEPAAQFAVPPAMDAAAASTDGAMPVPRLPESLPVANATPTAPQPLPDLPGGPELDLTPSPVSYLPPPEPPAPAKVQGNPYSQLREARELYGLHKYEEAEAIARRLLPLQVSWAAMNDSPRKLLEDVGRARVHATQDGASLVLAEGRRALQQGDIDEAERLAQVAELIHGPQRWFATDDSPAKLMADIRAARAARGEQPIASTPINAPGAPVAVTGAPVTQPRVGIVGRIAARFSAPSSKSIASGTMPTTVGIEGEATVTAPSEPVVKAHALPRLYNLRERIAGRGNHPVEGEPVPPQVVSVPQQPGVLPNQLVNAAPRNPAVIQTGAITPEPEVLKNAPTEAAPPVPVIATPPSTVPPPVATPLPMAEMPVPDPQFLQTPQMANVSMPMPAVPGAPAAPEPIQPPLPPTGPVPVSSAPTSVSSAPLDAGACDACAASGKSLPFCLAGDLGFSLMRPYWKTNPAAFAAVDGAVVVGREIEFGLGTQYVPELSIGIIGTNNFGFRTNWWGFATSDRQAVAGPSILATASPLGIGLVTDTPGSALLAWGSLRMNVWDLELTRDFSNDSWAVLLAGGLRYSHIDQTYNALLRSPTGALSALRSGHNFNGVGPTLFARGRGGVGGGVYAYGEGRLSLLYGRTTQDAATLEADGEGLDGSATGRTLMPVGELGAGVGWRHNFDGMELFAETGLVSQVWTETGNSSRSAGASTILIGNVGAPAVVDHNLGLLGFTMKVGLNY